MAAAGRPISPHLQIYRWYLTMAISIAHRATGLALVVGLLLIAWWLIALAAGPDSFAGISWLAGSILGEIILFLWLYVLFFHLCNGVRHLVWDAGYGYDKMVARQSGIAVIVAAAALTLLCWILAVAIG
jgi:succinate dehydrogenase / fumarate reductase cytochrome b subunit